LAVVFGLGSFFVYFAVSQSAAETVAEIPPVASLATVATPPPLVVIAPSPVVETPSPSPTPAAKASSAETATSHARTTLAPVSTSGPGMGKKPGGKPVILLTSGGRIDADEVWRTRDGVWYRRAGIVTLLKQNRVKAILNQ
jgi:hypothetical protein